MVQASSSAASVSVSGSTRLRRTSLQKRLRRIVNSQARRLVPGVNWVCACRASTTVSCTRSSAT